MRNLVFGLAIYIYLSIPGNAAFLEFAGQPLLDAFYDMNRSYVGPTELQPQYLKPLLNRAPKGVYVSVGTERGFIGASLFGKMSHLLLIDHDPSVVKFNRINIALLRLSTDRVDYLRLRYSASYQFWLNRVHSSEFLDTESKEIITQQNWLWWRDIMTSRHFNAFHPYIATMKKGHYFEGANYLTIDEQFDHISSLAKEGKIQAEFLELSSMNPVSPLIQAIERSKLKVAVLDLSNAWQRNYLGSKIGEVVHAFTNVFEDRSIVVFTKKLDIEDQIGVRVADRLEWSYFGFSTPRFAEDIWAKLFYKYYLEHHFYSSAQPLAAPASFYSSLNQFLGFAGKPKLPRRKVDVFLNWNGELDPI